DAGNDCQPRAPSDEAALLPTRHLVACIHLGSVLILMSEDVPYLVDRADGVLKLSFNRPAHGNAIPQEAVPPLKELFASISGDSSVRVLLVRGEGAHFSAGGDVRSFARALELPVEE